MEIKIKKVNSQNQLEDTKKPPRKKRTSSKVKKIVPVIKPVEKNIENYVTETLADIDDTVTVDEREEIQREPILPTININHLEWIYNMRDKSSWFYLVLFGLSAGFIYFSYKYNNWMLALIVILGFVMVAQKNTKIENFRIDEAGINIQNQKMEWTDISSCGIETLNESTLLLTVMPNTFLHSKIYLPFEKSKEREVLYLINKYSKFVNNKSSAFDQIVKWIIF